ncbi:MAG: Hsp70 family protein [Gammaproteobacteria bacterium]|nr:Hsp70 family protein [Gammaproteobacteria bacterium]
MHCGLDFGTSNSALGVVTRDGGVRLLPMEGSSAILPSAIFYDSLGQPRAVGRAAIASYMDEEPGRFMRSMKSVLGTGLMGEQTGIGAQRVSYDTVLEHFIVEIKRRAETALGRSLDAVVCGRPVYFNDDDPTLDERAEQMLRSVLHDAGFERVVFQLEPIAAARHFETAATQETLALIADIGGGTSDFTLVRIRGRGGAEPSELLASHGVHIGGTDFDQRLSLHSVMPLLGKDAALPGRGLPAPIWIYLDLASPSRIAWLNSRENLTHIRTLTSAARSDARFVRLAEVMRRRLGHHIAHDVERAKIALSELPATTLELDYVESGLALAIQRADLAGAIEGELERLRETVRECLRRASTPPGAVGLTVLTGGSTEMPLVRAAITSVLPHARLESCDRFGAVAAGLALQAGEAFADSG